MKRVFMMALVAALLGWMSGGIARVVWATPGEAEETGFGGFDIAERSFAPPTSGFAAPGSRHQLDAVPEIFLAEAADEVLKARQRGSQAREKALVDALAGADLPLVKDGQWGEGYVPEAVLAHLFDPDGAAGAVRNRGPAGANNVIVDGPGDPFDLATPIPVVTDPGGPGVFTPPVGLPDPPDGTDFTEIPSVVPEPSTWLLMILAFIALALRQRAVKDGAFSAA